MKIILCGAGQVGRTIASHLVAEEVDLTVVDRSPEVLRRLGDTLDLRVQLGGASHPAALQAAGAEDADMLIAVTASDEVNMMACLVADELFGVRTKIARIRHQDYLDPAWSKLFESRRPGIDEVISPEVEVARSILRRIRVPGAFDLIPLADGRLLLAGVHCVGACPVNDVSVTEIHRRFADLRFVIVGIVRGGLGRVPTPTDVVRAGDDIYLVVEADRLQAALDALGHHEREGRRAVIAGGGNIGLNLVRMIEESAPGILVKLVEQRRERAALVSRLAGPNTVVLQGDVLDANIMHEACVETSEVIVAVTNDDETNILASMLAKREGCERAVTLINKEIYDPLIGRLGLDAVVSPSAITVSSILEHVRRGRVCAAHMLREGFGEIAEVEIAEGAAIAGTSLAAMRLPKGVVVAAVVRDGAPLTADKAIELRPGDRVIVMAASRSAGTVARTFA